MRGILLLMLAGLRVHRVRHLFAVLAIAGATALLLLGLGARDVVDRRGLAVADQILGEYEITIVPADPLQQELPDELDDWLRAQDDVARVVPVVAHIVAAADESLIAYMPASRTQLLVSELDAAPIALRAGAWLPADADGNPVVVPASLADAWELDVGDALAVEGPTGEWTLDVVGLTDEIVVDPRLSGLFVNRATGARIAGDRPGIARRLVSVAAGADPVLLARRLREASGAWSRPIEVVEREGVARNVGSDVATGLQAATLTGSLLGLIAACLIITSSLNAGIERRIKSIRMLRAIGASRRHVFLGVFAESVMLGVIGSAIGVVLGIIGLEVSLLVRSELFPELMLPEASSVLIAAVAPLLICTLAGVYPGLRAIRFGPLDHETTVDPKLAPTTVTSLGIAIIAAGLALGLHLTIGDDALVPAVLLAVVATCALIPAGVAIGEAVMVSVVSWRDPATASILHHQLTGAWGRSSMLVALLMMCLTLFVAAQVWGQSMLRPYLPVDVMPSHVVSVMPAGLPGDVEDDIAAWQGIDDGQVVGIAAGQTALAPSMMARPGMDDEHPWVLVIAVDPQRAFGGERPVLPMVAAVDVDRDALLALLESGGCLTTRNLLARVGVEPGEAIALCDPHDADRTVSLQVHEQAAFPGWQWISKYTSMRNITESVHAPVIVSRETGAAMFGFDQSRYFALEASAGTTPDDMRAHFASLVNAHGTPTPSLHERAYVRVTDMRGVIGHVKTHAGSVIWLIASVPLLGLGFALLGIVGSTVTSIRARLQQFGVLRSLGVSRRGVLLMIVSEMLTVSLLAVVLSIAAGIVMAGLLVPTSLRAFGVAGVDDPLVIPAVAIALGSAVSVGVVALAVWITASKAVAADPSELLTRPD